ncbi:MAG TPA: wax ester/triacylglycerol synthase family O-acyltransferase, partial [Myxococcota bacterium]|nr:wax ester/triacylglycerol synthase family O-acyltransferase [Myxococcota bacterium]
REAPLGLGLPEWVDDPHMDLAYHLRHVTLPAPGTREHLLELVAKLIATPLDRERPLWESYWIDGLDGGRAAYLMKLHHSVVDGVGSVAILNAITQAGPDDEVLRVQTSRRRAEAEEAGLLERLGSLAADQARSAAGLARSGVGGLGRAVREPRAALDDLARTARGLRGLAGDLLQPSVVDPLARSTAGISRRLDVGELPLERVRKIKAPLGVTINDVVLTLFAGALGAYHRERRAGVEQLNCMVPMNLRSRSDRDDLGNRVGTFNVRLPIGEKRPRARLRKIVEQTRAAKEDQRGAAFPMLAEILPLVPAEAFAWLARQSLGKVNVVCTNVPGVREPRYMAGAGIEAIYPFASPVEGTPVILALLSYAGTLYLGLDTDPEAVPDPHRLTELIERETTVMEQLAGVAGSD